MYWLLLTLLCAFSLASADAATKGWLSDYSARELALVRFCLAGLLLSPLLLLQPLPELPLEFWQWIAFLLPLEIIAILLYMRAIRDHPLSLTLPYLAFTPVFVILSGWLLLGERVSLAGVNGILLVVGGAWLLNLEGATLKSWRGIYRPLTAILRNPGSRMMLAVSFIYSLTSVGGKGAMQYMTPELFGPFYFSVLGLSTLVLFTLQRPAIVRVLWRRPAVNFLVALLFAVMVITHFLALSEVEVAYMVAVKRSSLLFGILYGALLFRERRLGIHLIAGGLMVAGVAMIATSTL
jgi:drug/metabolite transporter (DMT)-like permease